MSVEDSSSSSSSSEKGHRGDWWYAWLHIVVSVLGVPAVAAIPLSMAYLGWVLGISIFLLATIASYYSGRLLIQLQQPGQLTYANVADGIMGRGFAACWVRPFQFLVLYQVTIISALGLGQGFLAIQQDSGPVRLNLEWCVVLGGVVIVLTTLIPSIGDMWWLSSLGGLTAVIFSVMVCVGCVWSMDDGDVNYGHPAEGTDMVFGVLNSFGILAFSYGGHSVLPDVQASLGQGEEAQQAMQKALGWAYAVITPCYLAAMALAYWTFGADVDGFLPKNLQAKAPDGFILALSVMYILNSIALAAIYVQAGFNLVEDAIGPLRRRSFLFRLLVLRLPWVASATFISVALPFFGDLAGLSGAIGFTPMTFVFPFLLWERSDLGASAPYWRHVLHTLLCVLFCVVGIAAFAGALFLVIRDSGNFHFFHS